MRIHQWNFDETVNIWSACAGIKGIIIDCYAMRFVYLFFFGVCICDTRCTRCTLYMQYSAAFYQLSQFKLIHPEIWNLRYHLFWLFTDLCGTNRNNILFNQCTILLLFEFVFRVLNFEQLHETINVSERNWFFTEFINYLRSKRNSIAFIYLHSLSI